MVSELKNSIQGEMEIHFFFFLEMDQKLICELLDGCLLNEKEMKEGKEEWFNHKDPFPDWFEQEDLGEDGESGEDEDGEEESESGEDQNSN